MAVAFGTPVSAAAGGVGGTSISVNLTVSAGSTILVVGLTASGTALSSNSVADNVNGAYTSLDPYSDATFGTSGGSWAFVNSASGTLTITLTGTVSGNFYAVLAVEITGCVTSAINAHTVNNQTGNTGTALTSGNITPSQQPALIVGFALNDTGDSPTGAGAGFTSPGRDPSGGTWEWQRVTSTSAIAAPYTAADFGGHYTFAMAVYEATAAAPPVLRRRPALVDWSTDDPPPPRRRAIAALIPPATLPVFARRRPPAIPPAEPVFYSMGLRGIIPDAAPPVPPTPPLPFARRWLRAVLDSWEPEVPPPPRPRTGAPLIPPPPVVTPVLGVRRWLATVLESWRPVDAPAGRRVGFVQSGPTPPVPPPPAPLPTAGGIGNQTTGVYDPNIALSFLLSVQDPTGAPVAMNTFISAASAFNDYALATAGLLAPVRVASKRDCTLTKNLIGIARRVGASNTPEGSLVQYPHLIGAMGLSFQMVGLMDQSGATYANVESAAQAAGVYRYPPAGYPALKGLP